jgi:hypothetical protein
LSLLAAGYDALSALAKKENLSIIPLLGITSSNLKHCAVNNNEECGETACSIRRLRLMDACCWLCQHNYLQHRYIFSKEIFKFLFCQKGINQRLAQRLRLVPHLVDKTNI